MQDVEGGTLLEWCFPQTFPLTDEQKQFPDVFCPGVSYRGESEFSWALLRGEGKD